MTISRSKKLIEVALPLEAINRESAREKSIRHGHPSTLHLWWARRPLAACRAVLFASLVDDPTSHPEKFPTEEAQEKERQRLFRIIEELVKWENTKNEDLLSSAREEIRKSTGGAPPPLLDPFCGGGSIPLEAQRLGLEVHASDLNPVAVLITKALIEIPPIFAGRSPINPDSRKGLAHSRGWRGAEGLAEDVRHYGKWIRDEAEKRIGHLYPKVELSKDQGGVNATVIAWLWSRTVKCPNPACGAQMPLVRSFWLSSKEEKMIWIEPRINGHPKTVTFELKSGKGEPASGTVNRRGASCICCGTPVPFSYIRAEGRAHQMDQSLMAIVAKGQRTRVYLPPNDAHAAAAKIAKPTWRPDCELPEKHRNFQTPAYGMSNLGDLFTARQLVALSTFSDLVEPAREKVLRDALASGMSNSKTRLRDGGDGAVAYADAIATYLGLVVSRSANTLCSLAVWSQSREQTVNVFSRQALPMNWDFPEVNPFAGAAGDFGETAASMAKSIEMTPATRRASVLQRDAMAGPTVGGMVVIATDPPYYDNIDYADLSDFFYVWQRRALVGVYPDLFSTLLTPKVQELIAAPHRLGTSKEKAEQFFEKGLNKVFNWMQQVQHPDYPMTVYYAFKQTEAGEDLDGNTDASLFVSTGWEKMLEGLIQARYAIVGTWPMRTERPTGVKVTMNALASSIVLVCRPQSVSAVLATRREFISELKKELPGALKKLQQGNIAPVDLAQAAIGPGMAVFSRYAKVLESDGAPMTVRTALALINQILDEVLAEQESEFDPDTRWALAWFEQFGMEEAPFGVAETLSKAKNTAVNGLVNSGVLAAKGGKVRLLKRSEMSTEWDPATDRRLTVWEITQHLIRALDQDGEAGAASLLRKLGSLGDVARDLAYRLFSLCERKKWPQEALAYNSLVIAWPEIARLARTEPRGQQAKLSL